MATNLLKQVMLKPTKEEQKKTEEKNQLIEKIQSGYIVDRGPKQTQKKTFAPSTIAFGHGECPRYWYLAFDGSIFEDFSKPYDVANMESGTLSHDRIQNAMIKSGVAKVFKNDKGEDTTEFKITYPDPPIFGYGDAMIISGEEEIVGEIKTMMSEAFEYRRTSGKPKKGHLIQILIYMKILGKAKGVLIYENKNNHDMLVFPVEVTDAYREWVDYAFDWMRQVRSAWLSRKLPKKNYRSNAKVCKSCPVQKACAEAGAGEFKLASLEEISEIM